jgi:hypothetical protein
MGSTRSSAPSSPEAALSEHQQAWAQKDIARFLASIDFRQEAVELFQHGGEPDPGEAAIAAAAAERESQLRKVLETRGFIATDIGSGKIVRKLQDSENQVRFMLSCQSASGALLLTIRLMRFDTRWRVVRG